MFRLCLNVYSAISFIFSEISSHECFKLERRIYTKNQICVSSLLHINRFFSYCFVLGLFWEPHFSLDTHNSCQSGTVMKQSAFHLPKINYTKIQMTPNKNFPSKIHIFKIPKLVFYFCILQIITPELLMILYITWRTKPKLGQKTVFVSL